MPFLAAVSVIALAPNRRASYRDEAMTDSNELACWRDRHADHPVEHLPRVICRGLECVTCREVIWVDEARPDEAFS